jgi:hypothetical protein
MLQVQLILEEEVEQDQDLQGRSGGSGIVIVRAPGLLASLISKSRYKYSYNITQHQQVVVR